MRARFAIVALLWAWSACAQTPFALTDRAFLSATSPLRQRLAGCWRMEEAAGTRYDLSGRNNNLTSNNSVGEVPGLVGNCATFTAASSQYLSIADNATLHTASSSFEVATLVYLTSSVNFAPLVCKGNDAGTDFEFYLFMQTGTDKPRWQIKGSGGSSVSVTNGAAITLNAWHLVDAWLDTANAVIGLQVDGGTIYTVAAPLPTANTTQPLTLGHYADGLIYLDGRLDETQLWIGRVLTTGERASLLGLLNGAITGNHFPWTQK